MSQSMNPTNVPSRQTAFHGATSWWPITKPGRQVCPANQDTFAGTCRIGRRNPSTAKSTSGRRSPGWRPCWKEGLSYRPTCPRPRHLRRRRHGSVSMGQVGGPGGRELAAVFTAAAGFVRSGTSGTTPSDLSGHQRTELPPGWGMSMRTPANGANSDRTPSTWHSRKWLNDSRPKPQSDGSNQSPRESGRELRRAVGGEGHPLFTTRQGPSPAAPDIPTGSALPQIRFGCTSRRHPHS